MTTKAPAPRCTKNVTIASGVMRGQRVQCLNKAKAPYEHCAKHVMPWQK